MCTVEKSSNKMNISFTVQRLTMVQDWHLLFSSPLPPKQSYVFVFGAACTYISQKQKGDSCPSYLKLSLSLSQPLIINPLEEIQLSFSRSHHSQDFKLFTPKH